MLKTHLPTVPPTPFLSRNNSSSRLTLNILHRSNTKLAITTNQLTAITSTTTIHVTLVTLLTFPIVVHSDTKFDQILSWKLQRDFDCVEDAGGLEENLVDFFEGAAGGFGEEKVGYYLRLLVFRKWVVSD